jgi:protein SCO1
LRAAAEQSPVELSKRGLKSLEAAMRAKESGQADCYRGIVRIFTQAAALLICAAFLAGCQAAPQLAGTSLGAEPAPDFQLRDTAGNAVSLDQFRGKVVVLTFLYTHCTDYCPVTAELLRHADAAAGHPRNVEYIAISVDPTGDTPESIAAFSQEHHLDELGDRWHYLVGNPGELAGVWKSYYIGVASAANDGSLPPGEAGHSSALYFIDPRGNRRVLTELDVAAEDIARNELALAKG